MEESGGEPWPPRSESWLFSTSSGFIPRQAVIARWVVVLPYVPVTTMTASSAEHKPAIPPGHLAQRRASFGPALLPKLHSTEGRAQKVRDLTV